MTTDNFSDYQAGLTSPAGHAFDISVSDTDGLSYATRGIYVGTAGNLKVTMLGGETVTIPNISAGIVHPIRVKKVFETGTTADGIVGVY